MYFAWAWDWLSLFKLSQFVVALFLHTETGYVSIVLILEVNLCVKRSFCAPFILLLCKEMWYWESAVATPHNGFLHTTDRCVLVFVGSVAKPKWGWFGKSFCWKNRNTHKSKMTHGHRETNSQWSRTIQVIAGAVTCGKHGDYENKGNQQLDPKSLTSSNSISQCSHSCKDNNSIPQLQHLFKQVWITNLTRFTQSLWFTRENSCW